MQDLPQDFLTENSSVNVEFLENKKGEITAGTYLLSIAETVNGVQQIGTSALLAVKIYIFGLIWGIDSLYLFNSHSKEKNDNL